MTHWPRPLRLGDESGQSLQRLIDASHELWMDAVGDTWPLDRSIFARYAENASVVVDGGRALGLVLYDRSKERGSIRAIMVRPEARRQGLGTFLLRDTLQQLTRSPHMPREQGPRPARPPLSYLILGGGYRYIWPGIPEDLSDSKGFFDAVLGWPFSEPSYDMTMSLDGFNPPAGCYDRPAAASIIFRSATADDMPGLLDFEEREFPNWVRYVREHAPEDIVVGVDGEFRIVAALLFDMPPILWSRLLGERAAEIGAVGVGASHQNLGLGTALVARACEILRDRGVEVAVLRWLYRVSFYERIGFKVWKRYLMSSKQFETRQTQTTSNS